MQSSAWAAFKRAENYRTWRYGLFDEETLCGGGTFYAYPGAPRDGFLVCPEGPVLDWADSEGARARLRLLIDAARTIPEAQDVVGIRIEPNIPPPAPSLLRNWSRAPVDLTPIHTLVLDLTLSDAELLARMTPKGRYNIGLSQRHDVEVRRSAGMADLTRFYRLFQETAARNDFFAEPYGFMLNLCETLFAANQAELLLAEHCSETLAAAIIVYFGSRATFLFGGSSEKQREAMPSYGLHWAAMRRARERGCREYDLYGYEPFGMPDHLYAGISRFKKQFGGTRRDTAGAWDLVFYDRLAERVEEMIMPIAINSN